jgi:glycine cleavage system regulatory protein
MNRAEGVPLSVSLVLTLIGEDKPGLVGLLSQTVADHDGNWLESRMSRMAGRFAGILRASVPEASADALVAALSALESQGLRVVVERSTDSDVESECRRIPLELIGADRPGIIREISQALTSRHINVDELITECTSAPMSGEILFTAKASLRIPLGSPMDEIQDALEEIADDLMVELTLGDTTDT